MHELPFGAQMTERLFQLAQKPRHLPDGRQMLPCIDWAPKTMAVPGKAGWMLVWRFKSHTEPERVFKVDGVSIYISKEVEPFVRNQVFDWDCTRGVVSRTA